MSRLQLTDAMKKVIESSKPSHQSSNYRKKIQLVSRVIVAPVVATCYTHLQFTLTAKKLQH